MNENIVTTQRLNELLKAEDKYWEAQWFIGELHQWR